MTSSSQLPDKYPFGNMQIELGVLPELDCHGDSAGSIFLGWTGDGTGNITSCTVIMDQARSVQANFK